MKDHFLNMPMFDALELGLFIILIAGALGIIYREKFLYVVLVLIVFFALTELYRDYKEDKQKADSH